MSVSNKLKASVIIPVYNQVDSLRVTMKAFSSQTASNDEFEIIVIDDGSTDNLAEEIAKESWPSSFQNVRYIHQRNSGRAVARNVGIENSNTPILIFCDADRFPEIDFVSKHLRAQEDADVVVGCPLDFFGSKKMLSGFELDYMKVRKFSRPHLFSTKISKIYNEKGLTESGLAWTSLLIGNSSVKRYVFEEVGAFDSSFTSWGFEHFELGLRIQKSKKVFKMCTDIKNYHIPHGRGEGFYEDMARESIQVLKLKHPEDKVELLVQYLFGNISLQQFERDFSNHQTEELKKCEEIFYKSIKG